MSALLFHGPGAKETAQLKAEQLGRLVIPFVEGDLNTEKIKELMEHLRYPFIGSKRGVLAFGPIDSIHPKASNALLKALEETTLNKPLPILWASDIGNVIPTVKSRCLNIWCPDGIKGYSTFLEDADKLCEASYNKDFPLIIDLLSQVDKENQENFLKAVAESILLKGYLKLWQPVRELLLSKNPSKTEVTSAFLHI